LADPPPIMEDVIELVKKRLHLSDADFEAVMNAPKKTYADYATYKRTFERLRPLFWLLYKADRIPKSFYIKFTRPDPAPGEVPIASPTRAEGKATHGVPSGD